MNQTRFGQVVEAMKSEGLEQLLITEDRALGYLTGHKANPMERVGALLIKSDGEVHSFMNKLFRFPDIDGIISHPYVDGEDPYQLIADELAPGKIGIDDTWSSRHLISLLKKRSDITPELGSWAVDRSRSVKDAEEIKLLEAASKVNDQAIAFGINSVNDSISEKELADKIEGFFAANKGVNVGQYQVVCYGPAAADPHHEPDENITVKPGDSVLIDLIGLIDGYWCDMTRTVFWKEVSDDHRKVYEIVKKAQQTGIDMVKPGVRLADIDKAVRDVITEEGFGEYFITRTGHGVGLSCHEAPMCAPDSDAVCEPGQCFSIEPGIYIPGDVGVRIEDLVIVTEDGCEVLTSYPKDLTIVGN